MPIPLDCRALTASELAAELAQGEIVSSRAMNGATVYNLQSQSPERRWLAIALANGSGLAVETQPPPTRRRKADTGKR